MRTTPLCSWSLRRKAARSACQGGRQISRWASILRKLTDYRLGLFASRAYLETRGPIADKAAIRDHPLVWYIDELIDIPELRYFDQIAANTPTAFRSSSIAAQQSAVASGLGLGVLHLFAAEQDDRLVRVLADQVEVTRSYWLMFHADQQRLPRVRAVIEFLSEIVAANRRLF
jgi:DNA-binding transcriptional LysR family regulator